MMLTRNVRDQGSIFCWGVEFFSPSEATVTFGAQLLDKLTSFVWSRFPQRRVNVTVNSCLGVLVVMMLIRNVKDQGSIPYWGTEFFGPSEPIVTIKLGKIQYEWSNFSEVNFETHTWKFFQIFFKFFYTVRSHVHRYCVFQHKADRVACFVNIAHAYSIEQKKLSKNMCTFFVPRRWARYLRYPNR